MQITINVEPQEIAALVVGLQGQQKTVHIASGSNPRTDKDRAYLADAIREALKEEVEKRGPFDYT